MPSFGKEGFDLKTYGLQSMVLCSFVFSSYGEQSVTCARGGMVLCIMVSGHGLPHPFYE